MKLKTEPFVSADNTLISLVFSPLYIVFFSKDLLIPYESVHTLKSSDCDLVIRKAYPTIFMVNGIIIY